MQRTATKSEPTEAEIKATLFDACVGFVLMPVAFIWQAFVLQCMWLWFVTYAFGFQVPTMATCLGLAMLCRLMTSGLATKQRDLKDDENLNVRLLWGILGNAIFLATAWIVTFFR